MPAFIITRIQTGDYDRWRPMFDQDQPRARQKAQVQRVLRSVEDPNEVFVYLEFSSFEDANEPRDRLLSSGVLDRFEDKYGPIVLSDAGRPAAWASVAECRLSAVITESDLGRVATAPPSKFALAA